LKSEPALVQSSLTGVPQSLPTSVLSTRENTIGWGGRWCAQAHGEVVLAAGDGERTDRGCHERSQPHPARLRPADLRFGDDVRE
jgi:hypothetical protein